MRSAKETRKLICVLDFRFSISVCAGSPAVNIPTRASSMLFTGIAAMKYGFDPSVDELLNTLP